MNNLYDLLVLKNTEFKIKKLDKIPHGQAQIVTISDPDIIALVSYSTTVCLIYDHKYLYLDSSLYSHTTIKHISAFLKEFNIISYTFYKTLVKNKVHIYDILNDSIIEYWS